MIEMRLSGSGGQGLILAGIKTIAEYNLDPAPCDDSLVYSSPA